MKTSQAGLAFLAQNEGTVLHVYNDSRGIPTIGVGHMLTEAEKASGVFNGGITEAQALALLATDVGTAESWVNKGVTVSITQNMFDALVDFTYNCGGGAFTNSTLLRLLNTGDDMSAVADQFLVWDKPVEILGRRRRERTLFLTPDVTAAAPVVVPPPPPPPLPVPAPIAPVAVPAVVPPPVSPWVAVINFFVSLFGGKAN